MEEKKESGSPVSFIQLTLKEILIDEYNKHLVMYARELVEAAFTAGRPQDEVVFTFIQPSGNPNIPGIERNIKAKESQLKARKNMGRQDSILKTIQELINKENKKETKFE